MLFGYVQNKIVFKNIQIETLSEQKQFFNLIQSYGKDGYYSELEKDMNPDNYSLKMESLVLEKYFSKNKYTHVLTFQPELKLESTNDNIEVFISLLFLSCLFQIWDSISYIAVFGLAISLILKILYMVYFIQEQARINLLLSIAINDYRGLLMDAKT